MYRYIVFKVAITGTNGCTLESCILYFCNFEDSHISQGQEKIFDACGMVVHSELYIPVSSSIHHSLLDLVIISNCLVLTLTHEP